MAVRAKAGDGGVGRCRSRGSTSCGRAGVVHLTVGQLGISAQRGTDAGDDLHRSRLYARPRHQRRTTTQDRVAVQRPRRPRPRRRARIQRHDRVVLRTQRARRPRLLAPLARSSESWRHHGHRLESGRARGHPHRRIPVPRRFHGRQARRPCSGYALGSLGAHGRSHRRAPARMGRHRERPRAAVLTRDAAIRRRR